MDQAKSEQYPTPKTHRRRMVSRQMTCAGFPSRPTNRPTLQFQRLRRTEPDAAPSLIPLAFEGTLTNYMQSHNQVGNKRTTRCHVYACGRGGVGETDGNENEDRNGDGEIIRWGKRTWDREAGN